MGPWTGVFSSIFPSDCILESILSSRKFSRSTLWATNPFFCRTLTFHLNHWSNFRSQIRASSSVMVRFKLLSGLRVLSRRSSLSAGGSVGGRAGDLGLVLKTTNRSAFRKAASPVAKTSRRKVLTRSKWGCGTSSHFSSHVRCMWSMEFWS